MPLEPEDLRDQLIAEKQRDRRKLLRYDAYYEGLQPLNFVAPELYSELNGSVVPLVLNWPRMGTDAYENRLDVEGFQFPGQAEASVELWELWNDNDLDELSQQAHLESLALGRSYVILGSNEDDPQTPLITVEHPLEAYASRDPRTRKVKGGIKLWRDDDKRDWVTLYIPGSNRFYVKEGGKWTEDDGLRDDHGIDEPLIVPFVNRPRMLRQAGVPEFFDVMTIADAANKMATDMMISAEFHAMPRRWVFGMSEEDFQDENGNALTTWQQIAGRLWATEKGPKEVEAGQFPEADLSNFHNSLKLLAQLAAMQMALPPHYLAFTGDNPASADAIRSSEAQLVKRCERKQTVLGNAWARVMRLALLVKGETDLAAQARRLRTDWRDPATPTQAQKSDAVQKLSGGVPLLPREGAWDELGYGPERKDVLKRQFAEQDARAPLAQVAEALRS